MQPLVKTVASTAAPVTCGLPDGLTAAVSAGVIISVYRASVQAPDGCKLRCLADGSSWRVHGVMRLIYDIFRQRITYVRMFAVHACLRVFA